MMSDRSAIFLLTLLCIPALASAHGPSRQKVEEQIEISAPAEKVWAIIQDFCSISNWHPSVKSCENAGGNAPDALRTVTLDNGERINEKLVKYDAAGMSYSYMLTGPNLKALPINTLGSSIAVKPSDNGGTIVAWKGAFYRGYPGNNPPPELNDEAGIRAVTGLFQAGLAKIKELAEQQ